MDKRFDRKSRNLEGVKKPLSQEITGFITSRSENIKIRRWITTANGVCPICSSRSIIKYFNYELVIGCLVCGWNNRENLIQRFY